jgi:SAM-dependent methyltransferase
MTVVNHGFVGFGPSGHGLPMYPDVTSACMAPFSIRSAWRYQGTLGLIQSVRDRFTGTRSLLADEALAVANGANGLEVGGPSGRFRRRGMLPLYPVMSSLDNVNFAVDTLWEHGLEEGAQYAPAGIPVGTQFVGEATDLGDIAEASYDLVLSSHCIEHIANPLRALREWRRVCILGGYLCLVVPHRDGTFDRRRPVTSIEHFRSDARRNVDECDETHFDEVIRLHDLRKDPGVRSLRDLKLRVAKNRTVRGVHHHVFDLRSAVLLTIEAGWTPIAAEARRPFDIVILAQHSARVGSSCDLNSIVKGSPFQSDR